MQRTARRDSSLLTLDPQRPIRAKKPLVRATKLGRRLYVEIDFVVARDCWTVDEEDAVRLDLVRGLATLPYEVWGAIDLTTRPKLAE